jgi:type IV pilus assembly protein PilN
MKIPINLASQPFRRDRALVVASLAVSTVLLLTLGSLVYLAMVDNAELKDVRRNIAQLNVKTAAATAEQARLEAILRKPENASVLETTVFLNNLIYHKAISWSQLLEDLEKTIPYNVKLLMLHPTVNNLNQVQLDMMVGSESPDALVGVLKNLETSPMFGEVYDHSQQYPTQAEPLHRMRITVNYAHKL